jgi:hypothetical protein
LRRPIISLAFGNNEEPTFLVEYSMIKEKILLESSAKKSKRYNEIE